MPRYQVIEVRAYYSGVLIDAETEEDARALRGEIIGESETDSWADRLQSIEQVADDTEEIELP